MDSPTTKLCGIIVRKERWGLSWRGRLLVASVMLLASYVMILNLHPFLAVTHRVNTNVLVVEGWIHQFAAHTAAEEFKIGSYTQVFTTGGPVSGSGGYINDYNTEASVGAGLLRNAGVPAESLQMVPSRVMGRDRTYNAAVALRDYFREHKMSASKINVLTEDAHARRTHLLFQKAFGQKATVGIISVRNPDYDPKRWWRYSEGVREVLGEGIAYLYARFFFYPSKSLATQTRAEPVSAAQNIRP